MKSGITGEQYNYLQIAAMLIYMQFLKENKEAAYNVKNIPEVMDFLKSRKKEVHDFLNTGLSRCLTREDLFKLAEILPGQSDKPYSFGSQEPKPQEIRVPQIKTFSVTPSSCFRGDDVVLTWEVEDYTHLRLKELPNLKITETSSVRIKNVMGNKDFTLIAENKGVDKQKTASKTVSVRIKDKEPEIKSFSSSSSVCNYGDSVSLNWVVENADKVRIKELPGKNFSLNDSVRINNFTDTKTFTLIAENKVNGKPVTKTKSVSVSLNTASIPSPQFTNIEINGSALYNLTVNKGQTVRVSWVVRDATSVFINGVNHGRRLSGMENFTIDEEQTIQLSAVNVINDITKRTEAPKIRIQLRKVNPPPPPKPDIVLFEINGQSHDYIETTDTKLTFRIEAKNTDKLELMINGNEVKIRNAKYENGSINGKFDVPFQVGNYTVVLKALNHHYQLGQVSNKRIIVKEVKVDPPQIVNFEIDNSGDPVVKVKKNSSVAIVDITANHADFVQVYVNNKAIDVTNSLHKTVNGSIKGQFEIVIKGETNKYVIRIEARKNGRSDIKEKTLEITGGISKRTVRIIGWIIFIIITLLMFTGVIPWWSLAIFGIIIIGIVKLINRII
jgi:hypothetical protein